MNRVLKFAGVGVILTLFDFMVYTVFMVLFFGNRTEMAKIAAIISGLAAMILAYIMHRNITWKERQPGQYGVAKFFVWNVLMAVILRPIVTAFFTALTGLYQFGFSLVEFLGLPFSYEFVANTGIYCLMTAVVMVLNFLVYEKLVFGEKQGQEKVNMEGVGQPRKEQQGQRKGKGRA